MLVIKIMATLAVNSLLTLTLILRSLNQVASDHEAYFITTSTDLCPTPCLTLSQFATNISDYLHCNTTLVFFPGTHYLTLNLAVSDIDNFLMTVYSKTSVAQIMCTNDSHLLFNSTEYVSITNIVFIGCNGNQAEEVDEFVIRDTNFQCQEGGETALELIGTTARIINCKFISSKKLKHSFNASIGGATIVATKSKVNISQSNFEKNTAEFGGALFAEHSIIPIHPQE